MKINELIKAVTKDYMPIKKNFVEAQKEGRELTKEESKCYFELNTTLEFYKILKGMFMEEVTKNDEMNKELIKNGVLTTHIEKAEKDGKEIDVEVIDQSMDFRIDNVPENIQMSILEKLVKAHKDNIQIFENTKVSENTPEDEVKKLQNAYKKELFELNIIESFLPKEATREDIMAYLNENYPDGITQREMGPTIGKTKKAFERADGKMVSECVRSIIHN